MSGRCEECGAATEWDQDLGSAICLQCGTLADPTQSVFTSHLDYVDTSAREFTPWFHVAGGSTLRGRNGRVLAGQDKEARDRRNRISMHEFIRTLATRLSNPGITSRAQGIFDQAMRRGQYRWGRRAKLTAGAALAIALRESHKSDSIRDIAYLLDEPPVALSRAFSAVVELLGLKLSTADPTVHLPALQAYLVSLVDGAHPGAHADAIPAQLKKTLPPLMPRLPTVMCTANSLSTLLERTHALAHLPTPPTACALLLLALEAESGSSLPHAGALAQTLGARFGAGKGVVMQRYKQIYDLVEEWIRDVPWLDAHERKRARGRAGEGRSKVAKRVVVARGLKDVVQFQEEIWRKRVDGAGRPALDLDIDEKDEDASADDWNGSQSSSRGSEAPSGTASHASGAQKSKKTKTRHPRSIVDASHFLLNPLSSSPLPSSSRSDPASATGPPDLLTHLLTADASSLSHAFRAAPSRLQLLAAERGGADEEHIADEELFGADELEDMMRTPEEAEAVRIAMGWEEHEDGEYKAADDSVGEKKRTRKRKRGEVEAEDAATADMGAGGTLDKGKGKARPVGSKKINMEALARLLNPDLDITMGAAAEEIGDAGADAEEPIDEGEDDEDEESSDGTSYEAKELSANHSTSDVCGGEVVEEWRPMSPGAAAGSAEDWYDF
ncbi:hypothetical protein BV20DRAFT_805741 [Pilatotrama ljubarskyi]|nr:hypothetical protein BV20DRAFT_805741 [Pilatotrama ljubarskyi]